MRAEFQEFNGDWFKDCATCGKAFGAHSLDGLAEFFPRRKGTKDGLKYSCKECVRKEGRVRDADPKRGSIRTRKKNPEKYKARMAVNNRIASGKLKKQPCRDCGSEKVEAHHPDYSKPLDVIWLCQKHHKEEHKRG